MKTAFDIPPGSANFRPHGAPQTSTTTWRSPRRISQDFHRASMKTGTEAAAATAVAMVATTAMRPMTPPKPIEV